MSVAVRLFGFATALALVFGVAWWAGALTAVPGNLATQARIDVPAAIAEPAEHPFAVEESGLLSAAAGYAMVARGPTMFRPNVPAEFAFVITGPDGQAVTAFDIKGERPMDLVVVRRDGTGFQHVLPVMGASGVWRAQLDLTAAGGYRAYADFVPTGGPPLLLSMELSAPGKFAPEVPKTSRTARVDGYDLRLDADLVAGTRSEVVVAIDRAGLPVTDLEPRLGALGQLVVVRQSDMARLRVSPLGTGPDAAHGGEHALAFTVELPVAGLHRLFLEFQDDGAAHTAIFTVTVSSGR
jgi:hypothetical protein